MCGQVSRSPAVVSIRQEQYPIPTAASDCGRVSMLNCGLVRDRGNARTSTTSSTAACCNEATNSAIVRVE